MAFDSSWPPQESSPLWAGAPDALPPVSAYAAGLANALAAYGLSGAQDSLALASRLGLAAALEAYPGAGSGSSDGADDSAQSLTAGGSAPSGDSGSIPDSIQGDAGQGAPPPPIADLGASVGMVPPSGLAHDLPDLTIEAPTAPDGDSSGFGAAQSGADGQDAASDPITAPGADGGILPASALVQALPDVTVAAQAPARRHLPTRPRPSAPAPPGPTIYRSWKLPNGQVARQYDAIQGRNVIYHHGDLGGAPGVYVDDPEAPGGPRSLFTPTGPRALATASGFFRSPQIGPAGQPYYDKLLWRHGGQQGFLRVDAQGHPVKAFTQDLGEVHDAYSPTDFIGPGEIKLGLELAFAAAAKAGASALLKGGGRLAASNIIEGGENAAVEAAETPVIQLGGAHRDVKGLPGYEAHHMPADAASPVSTGAGPAIAMRSEDHHLTASWGPRTEAKLYRQQQADLIAQGRFRDALQMDIDDIRRLFGDKYDSSIRQMLNYVSRKGY